MWSGPGGLVWCAFVAAPSHDDPEGPFVHFFDESTDFTKALAWPPQPHPSKFGGEAGFTTFIKDTVKSEYGVDHVACWHAAAGYWGGVDSPGAEVLRRSPRIN